MPSNDDFRFEAVEDGLRTIAGLDARDIDVAADGSFRVTLDARPTASGERNHLTLPPGANTVVIRDTLADWRTQRSNLLTFSQSAGAPPPRGSADQARRLAVALVAKTDTFVSGLLPGSAKLPEDHLVAKVRTLDHGLPGYIFASGRYKLRRDEALVVTVNPQAARAGTEPGPVGETPGRGGGDAVFREAARWTCRQLRHRDLLKVRIRRKPRPLLR